MTTSKSATAGPIYHYDRDGKIKEGKYLVALNALRKIAAGTGYYGMQAREYKDIAIAALAELGELGKP